MDGTFIGLPGPCLSGRIREQSYLAHSVVGPAVWKRRDFLAEFSWIRVFTAAELSDVHGAMQKVNIHGSGPETLTANVGPLPVLKATMDHVRDYL